MVMMTTTIVTTITITTTMMFLTTKTANNYNCHDDLDNMTMTASTFFAFI